MSILSHHGPKSKCFAPCQPGTFCACTGKMIPYELAALPSESSLIATALTMYAEWVHVHDGDSQLEEKLWELATKYRKKPNDET